MCTTSVWNQAENWLQTAIEKSNLSGWRKSKRMQRRRRRPFDLLFRLSLHRVQHTHAHTFLFENSFVPTWNDPFNGDQAEKVVHKNQKHLWLLLSLYLRWSKLNSNRKIICGIYTGSNSYTEFVWLMFSPAFVVLLWLSYGYMATVANTKKKPNPKH